jgi:hypothetical protein
MVLIFSHATRAGSWWLQWTAEDKMVHNHWSCNPCTRLIWISSVTICLLSFQFGNTCYCNSVLQALYFCRPFREKVLQYKQQQKNQKKETLLTCLADLFYSIATQKKKVGTIAPKKFIQRLRKENGKGTLNATLVCVLTAYLSFAWYSLYISWHCLTVFQSYVINTKYLKKTIPEMLTMVNCKIKLPARTRLN